MDASFYVYKLFYKADPMVERKTRFNDTYHQIQIRILFVQLFIIFGIFRYIRSNQYSSFNSYYREPNDIIWIIMY